MKTLTKLFVAVVALFAYSCATDTTEDLAVDLAGNTTLTLSLDEATKTHFGEKLNGVYPLYWSEGDQISVNGLVSSALTEGGSANATFSFSRELAYPYSVVYPAAEEGANEVTFPSAQRYVDGTFAEGAVPMYGYAERVGDVVQMQHLAGVLRFPIWGEGTISSLVVEAQSGSLSGTYTIDCATGELTPKSGSTSSSVAVSFGEGLVLGDEATPIYVAVPAGSYGDINISIFTTDGKKMRAKFDTISKPISAGKVREFPAFKYDGIDNSEIIIDSKEALINFAANHTKNARVTANIDMTGVEWTPIDGYAFTFDGGNCEIKGLTAPLFGSLVGSLKNVKLVDVNINETVNPNVGALARNIVATNDALTVSDCSVSGTITVSCPNYKITTKSTNTEASIGGLFGYALGVKISNCKNMANVSATQIAANDNTVTANVSIAGLVGYIDVTADKIHTTDLLNCENTGSVTFNKVSTNTTGHQLFLAGICGQTREDNTKSVLQNLTNRGVLTVENPLSSNCYFGGICGHIAKQAMSNAKNYGPLTAKGGTCTSFQMGGVVGYATYMNFEDSHNYAAITVDKSAVFKQLLVGGLFGKLTGEPGYINKNLSNSGAVSVYGTTPSDGTMFRVGGLGGWSQSIMDNCINYKTGTVTVDATITIANGTGVSCIGGVVGYKTVSSIDGIKNEADINVNLNTTTSAAEIHYIGGALGYLAMTSPATLNDAVNEGNITVDGYYHTGIRLGGVAGARPNHPSTGMINTGDITLEESAVVNNAYYIGALMASYSSLKNSDSRVFCNIKAIGHTNANIGMLAVNDGTVISMPNSHAGGSIQLEKDKVITLTVDNYYKYLFPNEMTPQRVVSETNGFISSIDAEPQYPEIKIVKIGTVEELKAFAQNAATLTDDVVLTADLDMSEEEWTPIGDFSGSFDGCDHKITGLKASLFGITQASAIRNLHLVDVNITHNAGDHSGAIADKVVNTNAVIENCSASGTLAFVGNTSMTEVYAGGLIGATSTTKELKGLTNKVNITITGSFAANTYFIGCVGYCNSASMRDCKNLGTVTCSASFAGKSPRLGGIASYSKSLYSCVNGDPEDKTQTKGSITFDGKITGTAGFAIIAGITPYSETSVIRDDVDNCHNYGRLTMGGTSSSKNWVSVAGIAGNLQNINNLTNCSNNGDIILKQVKTGGGNTFIGGMGNHPGAGIDYVSNCVNNGDIIIESTASLPGDLLVGGMFNVVDNPFDIENVTNTGDITFDGTITGSLQLGAALSGRIRAAKTIKGNIVNTGNVSCNGTIKKNGSVGGIIGFNETASVTDTYFADAVLTNRGKMTFGGSCSTAGTAFYMGGIFGRWIVGGTYNATNYGDIEVTDNAQAESYYVGGYSGGCPTGNIAVSGVTSVCTIKAYKRSGNTATRIPNVGFLFGMPRSETLKAVNCNVGGLFIDKIYFDEDQDDVVESGTSLTADNLHKYIYGTEADKDAVATDGCTVVPYIK